MKVTVFGTGYVGLVTAVCLAEVGNTVTGVDISPQIVEKLSSGEPTIFEQGLPELLSSCLETKQISFTTEQNTFDADVVFIAVGTPQSETGEADCRAVFEVAHVIGETIKDNAIIVLKSTVPIGTGDEVEAIIKAKNPNRSFSVVSNPEFLKEGVAINDFKRPDRIVVGTDSDMAKRKMTELYAPFNRNHEKLIFMSRRSSEFLKYAANTMLATKISMMNELSFIAEEVGADIEAVRRGMGTDPRIGFHFIYPGCGFGGSCFPKDIQALSAQAKAVGHTPTLIDAVGTVNQLAKARLFKMATEQLGSLKGQTVAIWGLSFKPGTDDIREAPSLTLIDALLAAGAKVQVTCPQGVAPVKEKYSDQLAYFSCKYTVLEGAAVLFICTEWQTYKSPDFEVIRERMQGNTIIDGRNLFEPESMKELGFNYQSVGRKA